MRSLLRIFLSMIIALPLASWGQVVNSLSSPNSLASEFYVGREIGKPLVAVSMISGVNKPGVYHVPIGSDIAQVIAYAGGALEKADLSEVSIRRTQKLAPQIFSVNLVKSLASASQLPVVADSDVVHIPVNLTMEKTTNWVGLVSGLTSVVLSIVLINDINRK